MHATVSFASFVLAAGAATAAAATSGCAEGLYMLVARGTGEKPGAGVTGNLTQTIARQIPGSVVHALDYPASFRDPAYGVSEAAGVAATRDALQAYVRACPAGKVAIFGYSQGAQATGNALCGGIDRANFGSANNTGELRQLLGANNSLEQAQAIDSNLVLGHVISIVHFGDPAFAPGRPYDVGTARTAGIFERQGGGACERYAPMWQSWCDTDDLFCASGKSAAVHQSYIQRRGKEAAEFVVKQWELANKSRDNSTAPTPSSVTAQASRTGLLHGVFAALLLLAV